MLGKIARNPSALGWFLTLVALPSWAQSGSVPIPGLPPKVEASALKKPPAGPAELARYWQKRRLSLQEGNVAEARAQLGALQRLRIDLGISSLPIYALALLREARRALDKGDAKRGLELCAQAEALAPNHPDVHFTFARAHFADDTFGLGRIFGALFKGAAKFFEAPRYRDTFLFNLLIVLGFALLAAALAFLLLQAVRHLPLLFHNVTDLIGAGRIPGGMVLAIVLMLPIVFGLGPLGIILLWTTIFWFYQRASERVVTLCVLGFAALAPLWPVMLAPLLAFQTQVGGDLLELSTGHPSPVVVARSEARLHRNPSDFEISFLLARLYRTRAQDAQAGKLFETALAAREGEPRLLNEYGNYLLATGKIDAAIRSYTKATKRDPRFAAAYYNLAQAYRLVADKGGGENLRQLTAALQAAERLDPVAVKDFRKRDSLIRNRYVMSPTLPAAMIRKRAAAALGSEEVLRSQLWERFSEWLPRRTAPWVPLGLMFLLGLLWIALRRRQNTAFSCARCGATACAHCHPEVASGDLCVHCHHVYFGGSTVDPRLRLEKEVETHRRQTRRRRVWVALSAVVMGAGQVLAGRPARGVLLLLLFFYLAIEAFFWNGMARYPMGVDASVSVGKMVLLAVLFLPAYLAGLAGVLKK